jgi:DNA polymerase III delta prime subunit
MHQMINVFAPCILDEDKSVLLSIIFQKRNQNDSPVTEPWPLPHIHENLPKKMKGDIEPRYRAIERYFNEFYPYTDIETPVLSFRAPSDFSEEEIEEYQKLSFTDSAESVLLCIFLAAAQEILDLPVREDWQSVTATGNFKKLDINGNLILESVKKADKKFDAFEKYANDEKNKCGKGKRHLFLYINDEDEADWEEEKKVKSNKKIIVKSFSPKNDTLFDILDFVFDLSVQMLPEGLIEEKKEQEKYFSDFKEKTEEYITEQIRIEPPMYDNKTYSDIYDKLEKKHLLIHGPRRSGKSYLAVQVARYMVWNRKKYAPIWIKNITKPTDDVETQYNMFWDRLCLFLKNEDKEECLLMLKKIPFLIIIDDLPEQTLDVFLERMMEFSIKIKKKSNIIFVSTKMYDKEEIKRLKEKMIYLNDFPLKQETTDTETNVEQQPVSVTDTVPDEQMPFLPPEKQPKHDKTKRNVLMGLIGFAILGLILFLLISLFHKPDMSNNEKWEPPFKPTPLTADEWEDGSITESVKEVFYSFSVTSGTEYFLWLNGAARGNGNKTLYGVASVFYSNEDMVFTIINFPWDNPESFIASSTGTVYVRVDPAASSYTGTYSIVYSTGRIRPHWEQPSNPIPLTANQWEDDSLTTSVKEIFYSFSVTKGTKYYLWWYDLYQGDYIKTLNIDVSAFYSSGHIVFADIDSAWDQPESFTANSSGTVYVRVYSHLSGSGTYSIVYNTTSIRPKWKPPSDFTPLKNNQWENGNITVSVMENWYSFSVISGTDYYLWLNNYYHGDGTKTLEGKARVFYSNGDLIKVYPDWDYSDGFTASSSEMVHVIVYPNSSRDVGTYGIVYSTSRSRRPDWQPPSNPTPLAINQWEDVTDPVREGWYSFSVTGGTQYYLWLNGLFLGDGTKTMNGRVSAFYSNGEPIFTVNYSAWDRPVSFTASFKDTVYVRVYPYPYGGNETGTYSIVYSTGSIRPDWEHPSSYIALENDEWEDGNITESIKENWYSFSVKSGVQYYLWVNDRYKGDDSTKTTAVNASAFYDNGDMIVTATIYSYDWPLNFTAHLTGTVYIRVYGDRGTYGIVYSNSSKRPGWDPFNPSLLEANKWKNDSITESIKENWYSFPVEIGTQYYFWLNDRYDGDGTKTLVAHARGFNRHGENIFNAISSWRRPETFTASSTGTVYVMVHSDYSGETGTFGIVYSTDSFRPD